MSSPTKQEVGKPAIKLEPASQKPKRVSFEIGVVYRKGTRHFLAVTNKILISFKNSEVFEVRPNHRYESVRSISVEELCKRWGIALRGLDKITSSYLSPPIATLKTRPRGSRRRRAADEDAWRQLRTIRVHYSA
ncbi:MAG: hypothetical protein JKY65_03170 [Planctomycetes bacterium]|nr:hypothetical protein [Planctomycetota bacterium]